MVQLNVRILNPASWVNALHFLPSSLSNSSFIKIGFIYHKVHSYFKVYNSVVFIQKGVHQSPLSNSRTFTSPKKETLCPLAISLYSSLTPSPWQPLNLLAVSMERPVLNISYKCDHTIYMMHKHHMIYKYKYFLPLCGFSFHLFDSVF